MIKEKTKENLQTYTIDPIHSRVEFEVKHLGLSTFRGDFNVYQGSLVKENDKLSQVAGTVDIKSIRVPENTLHQHLLSADFFDAENYPQGEFVSNSISQDGNAVTIEGELTLRGVTKAVTLIGEVQEGKGMDGSDMIAVEVEGDINRKDYGISWSAELESGAAVVAEKVTISLHIEAKEKNHD